MLASVGPSALWYLTRGTGVVALLLLTLSVALGVVDTLRVQSDRWPRFVVDTLHRNASLLALAVLAVHIVTSVLDPFAPITVLDAVVPFASAYRPIWLGLGTLASDMLLAVIITSVARRRIGHRVWRATHWLAYACWPIAVVHGLGTGTDTKFPWMLLITAACLLVVLGAVIARLRSGWPQHAIVRGAGFSVAVAVPIALIVWLAVGPLGGNWARRAGTPASLLTAARAATAAPAAFESALTGTLHETQTGPGQVQLELNFAVANRSLSSLVIVMQGQPGAGGGLAMTSSSVALGTSARPSIYSGAITSLSGPNIAARVTNASGAGLSLGIELTINQGAGTVDGTLVAQHSTA
jgi:hypothetical protein